MPQIAIPYAQLRGGSSKGLYFLASDLPQDANLRNAYILAAMGTDIRQIDGLGGADPLTSKAAIVCKSQRPDADVDFLFLQVIVGKGRVDDKPNCGNILAGVGPFAIETGLVAADSQHTRVAIYMVNSGKICEQIIETPQGMVNYEGATHIDGVPGESAPIICNYFDLAGSACGSLFPTGKPLDVVGNVRVTCIDNGMPVAIVAAEDMHITGEESPEELNNNLNLTRKVKALQLELGPLMRLGDVNERAVPKICIVSKARQGGTIATRTFIPDRCHSAIGVLGAVSVATACVFPGTVCEQIGCASADRTDTDHTENKGTDAFTKRDMTLSVEHPSGEFTVQLATEYLDGELKVTRAGVIRTARLLSRGMVFVPESAITPSREQ